MNNLEDIIAESVEDATVQPEPEQVETPEVEASPEAVEAPESVEIESPAAKEPVEEEKAPEEPTEAQADDFAKRHGIAEVSALGRENRIPYSRVKKITEKAVSEVAEAALGRKLNPGEKAIDVVKAHVARIPELETKVTDYEERLGRVKEFEQVMVNDPEQFLQVLSTIPAYQNFFRVIDELVAQATQPQEQAPAASVAEDDPMPGPNVDLADGTSIYDNEGLQKLMDWQARQVEKRVTQSVSERYKPLEERVKEEEEYRQAQQVVASVIPQVKSQAADARTWPHFTDNEDEIVKVLQSNPKISLEAAYRQVVLPKVQADREKMRQELLAELKRAPKATAAPVAPTKPVADVTGEARSLEQVIADSIKNIK